MAFPMTLKQIRSEKKLTQHQLAEKIGVTTSAISGWELGRANPTADNIIMLCHGLGVSADRLLEIDPPEKAGMNRVYVTDEEMELLSDYSSLDRFGKKAVALILGNEKERISAGVSAPIADDRIIPFDKVVGERYIPKFLTPAAAGYSSTIDEAEFDMLLVDKDVPQGADYAVVIQGNSMLPYISDGATVFVRKTDDVSIGEIGIFSVNGAMYCKMFYSTGSGDIWLVSTNEELSASNVLVKAGSNDSFQCLGKILLKEKPKLPNYFMQKMIP